MLFFLATVTAPRAPMTQGTYRGPQQSASEAKYLASFEDVRNYQGLDCETCNNCGSGDCNSCCEDSGDD